MLLVCLLFLSSMSSITVFISEFVKLLCVYEIIFYCVFAIHEIWKKLLAGYFNTCFIKNLKEYKNKFQMVTKSWV